MRHIFTSIIITVALSIAFVVYANNRCGNDTDEHVVVTETSISDSIPDLKEVQHSISEILQTDERDWEHYYGDTLVQYGNTAVCISFGGETGTEEVSSIDQTMFITVRDSVPVDTCVIVDMHNGVFAKGETIYVMFGVDTMRFDARKLPKRINMMDRYATSKRWRKHKFTNSFAISDSSWNCDFYFQAYLPENVPVWTKKLIKTIINNDITALYLDNKGADRILKEYYDITPSPKQLRDIDASKATPEQIAAHYAKEHERLYRKDFDEVDEEGHKMGPKYDYLFKMNPAWRSKDGKYVTYRFYTFYYTMGMHGFMEEYYLTFDNSTGCLLGAEDLLKSGKFNSVIEILERKINDYKHEYMSDEIHFTADLDSETLEANSSAIVKENIKGKLYPRPAMTEDGMVFTYQPYEMGAFTEGAIHFLIPYNEIKQFLKIRR